MPIVGPIAAWLLKKFFISPRTANVAAWIIAVIGAVLLAIAGWQIVKAVIIHGYKTEQRAKVAEKTLKQTHKADVADAEQEARDQAATDQLQEGARDAASSDPAGAAKPVGPVTRSVVDGLRSSRQHSTD